MNISRKHRYTTPLVGFAALGILTGAIFGFQGWNRNTQTANLYVYPYAQASMDAIARRLDEEIAFYQERIRDRPEDGLDRSALASVYLNMARITGEANWYLLAEQSAQQSLANLPFDNQGAVLVLARVAEARHDFPETIRLAEQILNSQTHNEDALALLVTSNLAIGNALEASSYADRLVDRLPTLNALTLRALVREAQGKDEEAIADFQAALAAEEPGESIGSAKTRALFGRFYARRGEYEMARQLYLESLGILPQNPLTLVNLAKLELQQGNYGDAERIYAQLSGKPDSAGVFDHAALQGLAEVKAQRGDRAAAEKLWSQAEASFRQHHDLDSFGHRRELAHLLLTRGHPQDFPEALALMQAEANIRRDAQTLETLALALSRLGRDREAQEILAEAKGVMNSEF